tara:strand:+ start:14007 stop:14255 length:249 start_codon:yes stop_codon:yes gene_type:complete
MDKNKDVIVVDSCVGPDDGQPSLDIYGPMSFKDGVKLIEEKVRKMEEDWGGAYEGMELSKNGWLGYEIDGEGCYGVMKIYNV